MNGKPEENGVNGAETTNNEAVSAEVKTEEVKPVETPETAQTAQTEEAKPAETPQAEQPKAEEAEKKDGETEGGPLKDRTGEFDKKDIEESKTIAAVGYIPFLFFLPLVASPKSKFGRFHANQSLVLLIANFAFQIVMQILNSVLGAMRLYPIRNLLNMASNLISLGLLALIGYCIYLTASGKAKELPLVDKFTLIKLEAETAGTSETKSETDKSE